MDPSKQLPGAEGASNSAGSFLTRAVTNALLCRNLSSGNAKLACYVVVSLSILLGVIPWVDDLISMGAPLLPIF